MQSSDPTHCLITGASSGIGLAAVRALLANRVDGLEHCVVHALSRTAQSCVALADATSASPGRLFTYDCDLGDDLALERLGANLATRCGQLRLVFNAAGILHRDRLRPEKSVSQITRTQLAAVFDLNAFAPILLAQSLLPLLKGRHRCTFASLSARVGSIGDNRLGGWYAYRASKAAQNQLLRTFAIELKRLNPQACSLLLHPGTVDTPLSAPFQTNVPIDKLFTAELAAQQLLELAANASAADSGLFLAWDGTEVPW